MEVAWCPKFVYHLDMLKTNEPSHVQLRKPTDAIVMLPRFGKLTSFSRKLYLSLLREAQQQILQKGQTGEVFAATDFFRQKLSVLIKPLVEKTNGMSEEARVAIQEMQTTIVDMQAPDQREDHDKILKWKSLQLISEVICEEGERGDLYLKWSFAPTIIEELKKPKSYTLITPEEVAELTMYTSVALFEIVSRYKENKLTCVREKDWWVAALSGTNKKTKTGESKLRDWRRFKSERVNSAIEEINAKTKLTIELVEIKKGNLITDVQFKVAQKDRISSFEPTQAHIAAAELGVPAQKITKLLADGHSPEQASLYVAKLKSRQNDQTKEPIQNAASYLSAIVREENSSPEVFPAPAKVKTPKANSQSPVSEEPLIVEEVTPLSLLRTYILSVAEEIEANYLNKVRANLINNGILTPSATRALDSKNWKTGVIFSKVIEIYAAENFGPNWKDLSAADMDYKIKGRTF